MKKMARHPWGEKAKNYQKISFNNYSVGRPIRARKDLVIMYNGLLTENLRKILPIGHGGVFKWNFCKLLNNDRG